MISRLTPLLLAFFILHAAFGIRVAPAATDTLAWADNSNNESGFEIHRALGSGGSFVLLAQVVANSTAFADTAAPAGTLCSYKVRAFNAGGSTAFSGVASTTPSAAPQPPNLPPGGVTLTLPGILVNVSNRGLIDVGDATMIPGFVISGGPLKVLIRGVGPTLGTAPFNVPGVCPDPVISLRNGAGAEIATSDNWSGQATADAAAAVGAFALPAGSKDAALVLTLPAGNYTVVTSGAAGATGIALAEIYALP